MAQKDVRYPLVKKEEWWVIFAEGSEKFFQRNFPQSGKGMTAGTA